MKYLPEWFPGAQFQRDAKSIKAEIQYSRWLPYDIVKRQVRELNLMTVLVRTHIDALPSSQAASGLASPSLVLSALEGQRSSKNGDFDDGIISAAAMTLLAGS